MDKRRKNDVMSGGKGKIKPKDGKQFSKDYQPANNGRKPSLKKQLAKVAMSDGWMIFKKEDVQILDDKIKVKVPKEQAMALKMFQIAMGKNPTAALNAIKLYLETFDGKAQQHLELSEAKIKVTLTD